MTINKGSTNRCGIFLYYDRQGIVDDYVIYLLKSLRPYLKKLLVVINGEVNSDAMDKLSEVADEIMPRVNEGFDVGGYRDGIFHIGLDKLAEYDETILFNYTFFGPLYPFSEMFDKMDKMDLDFWGITRHYKVEADPYGVNRYGYLPEHIQSHFMGLRRDFIKSKDYIDFITNMKNPTSYVESICEYETIFAKHFEDLGYKWDTYVDTSEYEGYSYCPIMFNLKDMIKKQRCPIVKRRSFFTDYNDFMINTCGESSIDAYEYIRDNVEYDLDMVWDNILRLENMSEIQRVMHFNYMLPAEEMYTEDTSHKVAFFVYICDSRHFERYVRYINGIPDNYALYFIVPGEMQGKIDYSLITRSYETCSIPHNSYIEAYRLMAGFRDRYEYMSMMKIACVEVDKPYSNYDSWQYRDWENLLGTRCIIQNIITTFEENDRLGMLVPPVPNHGSLLVKQADGWQGSFDAVDEFLKAHDVNVNYKKSEPPLAPFGGSFFIRSSAIGEWLTESDKPEENIFEMSLLYLVQSEGFYSGVAVNNDYAAIEITNQDYMMRELNKAVFEKYGPDYHSVVVKRIENNETLADMQAPAQRTGIKGLTVRVLRKLIPGKQYVKLKGLYRKMRGQK